MTTLVLTRTRLALNGKKYLSTLSTKGNRFLRLIVCAAKNLKQLRLMGLGDLGWKLL